MLKKSSREEEDVAAAEEVVAADAEEVVAADAGEDEIPVMQNHLRS